MAPVLDQSLDGIGAIEPWARWLRKPGIPPLTRLVDMVSQARHVVEILKAWGRFALAASDVLPKEFASVDDVWNAAELLEPAVFEIVRATASATSTPDASPSAEIQGIADPDFRQRIQYVFTLSREANHLLHSSEFDFRHDRAARRALLENPDIPPEIRVALHQSQQIYAVLILFLLFAEERETRILGRHITIARHSRQSRQYIADAVREGLDSMIALLLAVLGPDATPAPASLDIPPPLPLDALEQRWQRVRTTWVPDAES